MSGVLGRRREDAVRRAVNYLACKSRRYIKAEWLKGLKSNPKAILAKALNKLYCHAKCVLPQLLLAKVQTHQV